MNITSSSEEGSCFLSLCVISGGFISVHQMLTNFLIIKNDGWEVHLNRISFKIVLNKNIK